MPSLCASSSDDDCLAAGNAQVADSPADSDDDAHASAYDANHAAAGMIQASAHRFEALLVLDPWLDGADDIALMWLRFTYFLWRRCDATLR